MMYNSAVIDYSSRVKSISGLNRLSTLASGLLDPGGATVSQETSSSEIESGTRDGSLKNYEEYRSKIAKIPYISMSSPVFTPATDAQRMNNPRRFAGESPFLRSLDLNTFENNRLGKDSYISFGGDFQTRKNLFISNPPAGTDETDVGSYGGVGDRFISPFEYVTPSPYAQQLSLEDAGQSRGRNLGRSVSMYWPEDENDNRKSDSRDAREIPRARTFQGIPAELGSDFQCTPTTGLSSIDSMKGQGRSSRGRVRTATTLDFDTSYKVKPYAPRSAGSGSGFGSAVVSPLKEDSAAAYESSGRSNSKGDSASKDRKLMLQQQQAPYTPHARDSAGTGASKLQNYGWNSAKDADAVGDRDRYKAFNVRRWKEEEDQALQAAVVEVDGKFGYRDWHAISKAVHGRNAKQCRERWLSQLAPSINREPWTAQEEKVLIQAHHDFGNKWTDIAKLLPGRTDNSVKNQWKSIKRRMESNTALSAKKRKSMEKQYGGYYTTLAVLPPKSVPSAAGGSRSRSSSTASDNSNGSEDVPDSARSNESQSTDYAAAAADAAAAAAATPNAEQQGRAVSPILSASAYSSGSTSGANPNEEARERGYYGDEEEAMLHARKGSDEHDGPAAKRRRSLSH